MDPDRTLQRIRRAAANAGGSASYCLGSRRRDLLAAALLALVVLWVSPDLRVYHRVTVMDVSLVRVEPDGRRTPLPTPPSIWNEAVRARAALRVPSTTIDALKRQIPVAMRGDPVVTTAPPGSRFEWVIRYSENSARLDRTVVLSYPAESDVRP